MHSRPTFPFLQLPLLLLLLLLAPGTYLVRPPRGTPQKLPGSYLRAGQTPNKTIFHQHIQPHVAYVNQPIPQIGPDVVRIVKYNVNMQRDLHGRYNIKRIMQDLSWLKATIVIFQQVPKPPEYMQASTHTGEAFSGLTVPTGPFWNMIKELNYSSHYFGTTAKASFGTVIAAKIGLYTPGFRKLDVVSGVTFASFKFGSRYIGIFDAPLKTARDEALLKAEIQAQSSQHGLYYYIVAAEGIGKGKSLPLRSVYDGLGWSRPSFTTWRDIEEDHMFCSINGESCLLGAYEYYTTGSDRIPKVVDIYVPGATNHADVSYNWTRGALFLYIFAFFFLTSITGFGVYHWMKSKLDPF